MNQLQRYASLFGGLFTVLTTAHAGTHPLAQKDLPFDRLSWVTTHNSYEKINQNFREIPQQLDDGVRGFMLDLYHDEKYSDSEAIRVCHKKICYGSFANQLGNEILPFLKKNRSEVVTLFLETYVTRDQLQKFLHSFPQVADVAFNPDNFPAASWPTHGQMAQKNQRLIIFTDRSEVAGTYTVSGRPIKVLFDQDWLVQNHWKTLGAAASSISAAHDFSCPTRWTSLPLSTVKVEARTGKQWNRLFLMNQFHYATSTTADSATYDNNLTWLMRRTANCGTTPNFIGINNYRNGDTLPYTQALSQGGIYLWERNNASTAGDTVCVIPRRAQTLRLPANGCENDEARSLSLTGIDKGTRITLFDNPSGNRADDHLIIDVIRDIGIHEKVVVGTLEQSRTTDAYRAVYVRNNGLAGKVSRVEIGTTPTDFSDASIALYEGNNAEQNLDCVVPFHYTHNVRMKRNGFGCSNDEIRSARIVKAKAGTEFTLTGHPEGSSGQGRTHVMVLRDITTPVVIPSFNRSYRDVNVKVTNHGQGIDGKISFGYFYGGR
ncbi:hypothetical protein [Pseudomonas sp. LP_7_YM]|uniref:hypothetical protein n=1 Tax=Pseudomonas sp. LP_7_YM TaxID=2485137 RepID=UPI0010DD0C32|nr:hypothetical protein [Pseudomonas sp. LP_7_YM]TDV59864.1 hypothetical protein EC915_11455 [Pseudomonas sp. LP_7_YM]